ncbi:MAG TPA: biotin transporter BioY [Spirochaetia bacterium]|nr:biotin transporter BioY [Spirochaetia bacterium]
MKEQQHRSVPLPALVLASLFAALTAVGAYISIPIPGSPVPVVAQNLFVLLAGMLLGWRWGAASIGAYLVVGILGLPVFSGGRGGIAHLLGPTGGYLIGFLVAAAVAGFIVHGSGGPAWLDNSPNRSTGRAARSARRDIAAAIAGSAVIYAFGVPWLKIVTHMSWKAAAVAGIVPFLVGDVLKAAAAVAAVRLIEPGLRVVLSGRYRSSGYDPEPDDATR